MIGLKRWLAAFVAVVPAMAWAGEGEADLILFFGRFHPLVLHLPIGILTAAVLFEVYNMWKPGEIPPVVTTGLTGLAAVTAVLAVALGLMLAEGGGYNTDILDRHKWITIAMTVCLLTALGFKIKGGGSPKGIKGYRVFLFLAVLLLGPGGHEGGNLTHGETFLTEKAPEPLKGIAEKLLGLDDVEVALEEGYYAEHIYPIFKENCFQCHGPEKQKGDYRLDIRAEALQAGSSDIPGIIPGDPMRSNLVFLITLPANDDEVMPPEGKGNLSDEDIGKIIRWIADGASYGDEVPAQIEFDASDGAMLPEGASAPDGPDDTATAADVEAAAAKAQAVAEYKAVIAALKPGTFRDEIFPILERSCLKCHGPEKDKGDLRLHTPEWIKAGADGEPVVIAGKPDDSSFYFLCTYPLDDDDVMPPEGKADPVTKTEQELIRKWIADGASFGL